MKALQVLFILAGLFFVLPQNTSAQYFGRNKPNYEKFDYRVYRTPHFEIYHYLNNDKRLKELALWAENWYATHQTVLKDTLSGLNPLLLYNDHADFQQTNAISGEIGVGTGGVTEAFKNRVVMPLAMSNEQTHHVLGHELVHAFQYDLILRGDSTSLKNLGNLPLWMVEGLAEYMSIGSTDAHTAMWMRDAVLNDDVPSLKDLNNPKYFPYRYGQVFWVFVTGLKGDDIIRPLFVQTAQYGFETACKNVLGMTEKELSNLWVSTLKSYFGAQLEGKNRQAAGKALLNKDAGELNIAPEISPNGRYVIFLTQRNLFSLDLYLADARTGQLIRKVAGTSRDGHLDDFNYIESSGAWSPDSRQFAFVAVSKGRNVLVIKDALSGKTIKETPIEGVPAFSNPAWSPNGKTIVVSGLVQGQVDLFGVNVKTEKVEQLTNDPYAEMHPEWAADGNAILFATDELSYRRGGYDGKFTFNLARLDLTSGTTTHFDVFPGADNLNPVQDTAGNIVFLSNRDGYRNIYRYEPATGKAYQLTDLATGVSGITPYAPALSVDSRRDRLVYTFFNKNAYSIYSAKLADLLNRETDVNDVNVEAAHLPKVNKRAPSLVDPLLATNAVLPESAATFEQIPYTSKFKLDYIGGSAAVGVGNGVSYGSTTGMAGGIDMIFSDIVGNHQIFSSLALNGEISDFGGVLAYINRKSRLNWGASLSHIPFRSSSPFYYLGVDTLQLSNGQGLLTEKYSYDLTRFFEDKAGVFAQLPFSSTFRAEAGAYFSRYSARVDRYYGYYTFSGILVGQERERIEAPDGFNLWNFQVALVGDRSSFGMTAPLSGYRFRLGADQFLGEYNFTAATLDYRIYKFMKPIGLAFRAMHYGRYGSDSESLYPLYVGSPWYVRGLGFGSIEEVLLKNGRSFDELIGSKLLVGNFEIRIPFTGVKQLALLSSKFLLTDLNFFVDGGVAWSDFSQFNLPKDDPQGLLPAKPIFSAGVSLRVNLFNALILEPYYAFPLLKNSKGVFGLNLIPGW